MAQHDGQFSIVPVRWCQNRLCGKRFISLKPARQCPECVASPPRQVAICQCEFCGVVFRATKFEHQKFCSPAHARKAAKKARRRLERANGNGHPYNELSVFERDGWLCFCGDPVDRDVVVPHPLAATIDHIVPVSQGGLDEPTNVRLAHFICNSRRGARGGGEQLRIV